MLPLLAFSEHYKHRRARNSDQTHVHVSQSNYGPDGNTRRDILV